MKNSNLLIPLFFALVTLLLFWQFFIKGLAPFPGNFMLAWYEPWKSDNVINEVITIPHKPVVHDAFRQLYPFKVLGMEAFKDFKLPLWNPYNGGGQPLFATGHMGYLNPFNFIYFIIKPELAWSIQVIIQPFLIGLSLYYYCRTLKLSKEGSLLAGASFMFSGFIITRTLYNDYNFAILGMILSLTVIEKFFSSKNKIILTLPFLIFFIIVSTQPQVIAYCLLFAISYFIFRLWSGNFKDHIAKILSFFVLIFLGVGLSAIQIIPTLELYLQSNLSVSSSKFIFDRFLLPPNHLISMFIPNYFGNVATYNYWGSGDYIESILSIGLIPTFFAFLAFFKKPDNKDVRFFFLAVIVLTILFSIQSPLTTLIYSLPIPVFSTGIPSRIFVLTTLSICILAAYGLTEIQKVVLNKKLVIRSLIFTIIPLFILILTIILLLTKSDCNNSVVTNCRTIALRNTLFEITVFTGGYLLFVYSLVIKRLPKNYMLIGVTLLVVISGVYNGQKFLPFSQLSTFKPSNDLITKINEIGEQDRFAGIDDAKINSNFATNFRFYDNDYYDPLYIKRYGELVAYTNGENDLKRSDAEINTGSKTSENLKKRKRLLELTGTKYLIYRNTIENKSKVGKVVWQNEKWIISENEALPRHYIVGDFKIENKNILKALFNENFNPSKQVIIEKKPNLMENKSTLNSSSQIVSYKNDRIRLKAESKSPGLLVISDNYYPGWKAYVNGKREEVLRANYTFRAVQIPKGNSDIEFIYESESIRWGIIISIVSLIIFSSFAYYYRYKKG